MKGEIVQEVKIFDPRNSPEYITELTKWRRSIVLSMYTGHSEESHHPGHNPLKFEEYHVSHSHNSVPEGPLPYNPQVPSLPTSMETVSIEELRKIREGFYMGAVLYPHALEYLRALGISRIFNLIDWNDGKSLEGVSNLDELKERLPSLYTGWPCFECIINPQITLGIDRVLIRMGWSSGDDLEDKPNYSPRSISISAKFDDPVSARIGLGNLKDLYPEAVIKNRLFAVGLPENVVNLYKIGLDYLQQHMLYSNGFVKEEPPRGEYDAEAYKAWIKEALVSHINFLIPVWKRVRLIPKVISYSDFLANLNYRVPVSSLEDVLDVVTDKSFHEPRLPSIDAEFNGRQVKVDMAIPHGAPDLGIGVLDYAMRVQAEDQEGVLEDLLESVQKC